MGSYRECIDVVYSYGCRRSVVDEEAAVAAANQRRWGLGSLRT
jgi:hypothetical protein